MEMGRTVGPTCAASFTTLGHHRNVVSLSIFYNNYFGKCSSELVLLLYSYGRYTHCSNKFA